MGFQRIKNALVSEFIRRNAPLIVSLFYGNIWDLRTELVKKNYKGGG